MGHDHHHHHSSTKNIRLVFFINLAFTLFEAIGGMYVNSVAILSDALHDLGDSFSLGLSWYLDKKSKKNPDRHYTFGYQRFSLLSALINSIVLIIGSVFVLQETIHRLLEPELSDGFGMFFIAIIGVVINGYAAWKLTRGKSMNERVLSWHLVEDVLGWFAVLIVSIVLMFKDIPWLDPALSLAITTFILYNVVKRLRETLMLFLQGAPDQFDLQSIIDSILEHKGIISVHNIHFWSLDGEQHVFSAHIIVEESVDTPNEIDRLKEHVRLHLKEKQISDITLEVEYGTEKHEHE